MSPPRLCWIVSDLFQRQHQQGAVVQRPQVGLVEQAVEQGRLAADAVGHLLQGRDHPAAVGAP